jgi:hypothetical protein
VTFFGAVFFHPCFLAVHPSRYLPVGFLILMSTFRFLAIVAVVDIYEGLAKNLSQDYAVA